MVAATAAAGSTALPWIGAALSAFSADRGNSGPNYAEFNPQIAPSIDRTIRTAETAQPWAAYGGDRTADFTPNQNAGLSMAGALSEQSATNQGTVSQGFNNFAGGNFVGSNPYLDQQVQGMWDSANRNLNRNVLPGQRLRAVGQGNLGSSRGEIAEGIAIGDTNTAAINAETGMRQQAYDQDMNNMLSALLNQGNVLSGQTNPMDILNQAGGMQQLQDQNEINSDMALFGENRDGAYDRNMDYLRTLLGTGQNMPQLQPQTNPLAAGVGGWMATNSLVNPPQTTVVPTGG